MTRRRAGSGRTLPTPAATPPAGLVDSDTVVVTTVHELQVIAAGTVPTTYHDLHVDLVVTAQRTPRSRCCNAFVTAVRRADLHVLVAAP